MQPSPSPAIYTGPDGTASPFPAPGPHFSFLNKLAMRIVHGSGAVEAVDDTTRTMCCTKESRLAFDAAAQGQGTVRVGARMVTTGTGTGSHTGSVSVARSRP